ncbi:mitochondrial 50S ribosomal protein L3 [Ramaria rubella]|nr:mitochondrial 50S ribosomal protein L3 [Ramaria rubella]
MLRFLLPQGPQPLRGCRPLHSSVSNLAKEPPKLNIEAPSKWTPSSTRTGVIARKRGMTTLWDEHGALFPVTVLQLDNCQVTANIRTVRKDSSVYHAVQVAATDRPRKTTTRQMRGHFAKAGVDPKRIVKEFPVTEDAHIPVGTTLSAAHFVPGQYVDVIGKSIGKGYAGTMKRWNFHGQSASHGTSVSHRSAGSTGQHQDPGRVWPGRKMAGRLGGERITQQNLYVARIDNKLNLIFVRGCVPGVDNAQLLVRDAKKKLSQIAKQNDDRGLTENLLPKGVVDLPFPAGTKELAQGLPPVVAAPSNRRSPFLPYT